MIDGLTYAWEPLGGVYLAAAVALLASGAGVAVYTYFTRASIRFFVATGVVAGWVTTLGLAVFAADAATEFFWLRATWVLEAFTGVALVWVVHEVAGVRRRALFAMLGLAVVFASISAWTPWLVEGLRTATRGLTLSGLGWLGAVYFLFHLVGLAWAGAELWLSRHRSVSRGDRIERGALGIMAAIGSLTLLDYFLPTEVYRAGWVTPPALMGAALTAFWSAIRHRGFALTRGFGTDEVLAAMSDVVLMLDEEGRVRGLNQAAFALLGHGREPLIGQLASRFLQEQDGESWLPEGGATLRDRELWVVQRDGERVPVSVAAEPLVEAGRQRGTVLVARDIRDRVKAEEALELQRRYFEDLFDNLPEAIVMVDENDRVVRMNEEFTALFGYTEEEAVGRPMEELVVPEGLHDEGEEFARRVAAGESIAVDTVRHRKDGSAVDVSILARRLDIPDEPLQIYAIYRDISDRKMAERTLREREEELRHAQKMEAVGTLAGGVAHDFNNLMTVINGHVRFVLEDLSDPERARRDLEEIERAGARAAELTQQLLAFSSRQVLRPRSLEINHVVRDLERMLRRLIGAHIRLETRLTDEECRVWADRGQLEQVLVNLAINARDAMPDGGVLTVSTEKLTVDADDAVAAARDMAPGPLVRITVEDTGAGIDEEIQEQIFDPFFTTKEPGKGTGLGLSTVFGIVKQSGGHVDVESEAGGGARFMVYLPEDGPAIRRQLAEEAGTAVPAADAVDEDADPTAPGATDVAPDRRTVLVAEDEAGVRTLAARVIERCGHEVITAADGREALEALEARPTPVDLVLTDIVMPEMGGRELARNVRARFPGVPILFMSGYDDELVGGGEEFEFIAKPFTPAALEQRISELLAASRHSSP